ncbi:UDP-GalNAc:beta-1,3-N-acetylgalactosaminyltransferase 2 [Portunus trituberculatus]|uniref:Hexosyltransferase n=1 Tax=Portunus trituberculatus TaxID=210409 RepID=A0A5B7D5W5_PORTR|nr:UDP-GalNAc:beta-1,3-N-acetylgalactosaminyltransferase 2 [Portunus trituberculatus]
MNNDINSYNRTAYKQNSFYLMKVDDDTFVNVNLLSMLTEVQSEEDQAWWSLFHYRRSVPAYGKWADFTYPSLTYPTFPAGSGYVMTKSLVRAVVDAQHHLVPHGGEDVSMGIWVSSVALILVVLCHFCNALIKKLQ